MWLLRLYSSHSFGAVRCAMYRCKHIFMIYKTMCICLKNVFSFFIVIFVIGDGVVAMYCILYKSRLTVVKVAAIVTAVVWASSQETILPVRLSMNSRKGIFAFRLYSIDDTRINVEFLFNCIIHAQRQCKTHWAVIQAHRHILWDGRLSLSSTWIDIISKLPNISMKSYDFPENFPKFCRKENLSVNMKTIC